jgi:flagellar protein FliS
MDAIQAYRESEITGDNPVHLVVLLYDQLLRDLQRALDAFRKQDIERRCGELNHALVVLAQLQGSLNLDGGGEAAQSLDRFYDLVRENLLRASMEGSAALLEKQWRNILGVREAWLEVERRQSPPPPRSGAANAGGAPIRGKAEANAEWKA